ncbi:MAG: hypothetical protein PHQ76_06440 [Caldisericia bacterium]|nr:hypothetical protein [Caldisericia bacterium]HPO28976.1 hypothetical protein [Caldisericia bacterium]
MTERECAECDHHCHKEELAHLIRDWNVDQLVQIVMKSMKNIKNIVKDLL